MTATVEMQSEYRKLPILNLTESAANPRRTFDETGLNELPESIKRQGVLSPLLVRAVNCTHGYEIVVGSRRFRAAQLVQEAGSCLECPR